MCIKYINPIPNIWGHYSSFDSERLSVPEDAEASDTKFLQNEIDKIFDKMYPPFEPEVITSITGKEYYLPALKVLKRVDNNYFSPSKSGQWKNMELTAICQCLGVTARIIENLDGTREIVMDTEYEWTPLNKHDAPDESCDCGIYGSVNLEELRDYTPRVEKEYGIYRDFRIPDVYQIKEERVLCVVEPSPDAKVILCRKGWKASKAFISEIIDETMGVDEASSLLSLVWHRNIDIRSLYENR